MRGESSSSSSESDYAIVGCGVLGTSLCRQLLTSPEFSSTVVTAITKTKERHDQIESEVLAGLPTDAKSRLVLKTSEEVYDDTHHNKFRHVVFCAPPSGSSDYGAAVEEAITRLWLGRKEEEEEGTFVFTSSGAVYAASSSSSSSTQVDPFVVVTERSALADESKNPRAKRLIQAEKACLKHGGTVLRLAGLYTFERGAHNYWLEKNPTNEVKGCAEGIVNLLHYDDAAYACLMATLGSKQSEEDDEDDDDDDSSRIYLISDGHPMTRKAICESSLGTQRYGGKQMPTFLGTGKDGKICDGTWSNQKLNWKPKFATSFDKFMLENQ